MLSKKLSIDLGTVFTRLAVRGENGVIEERTATAAHGGRFAAMGSAAFLSVGMEMRYPLEHGQIVELEALRYLLNHFLNQAVGRQRIFKPDVVVAVSSAMSGDNRRDLLDVLADNGVRSTYLLDSSLAAALGAGIPISGKRAHLIVDLGGGKTEIALLEQESTVASACLPQGIGDLVQRLASAIANIYSAEISTAAVVDLLGHLICCGDHEERLAIVDVGDAEVSVSSHRLQAVVDDYFEQVGEAIKRVLEDAPRTLASDISREGLVISGGGAVIEGAARFLGAMTSYPAVVVGEPARCTLRGTTQALDNLDVLKRNLMYIR